MPKKLSCLQTIVLIAKYFGVNLCKLSGGKGDTLVHLNLICKNILVFMGDGDFILS